MLFRSPRSTHRGTLFPYTTLFRSTSLRSIGLLDLFRLIVAGNEVAHGKPDPEILLRCAEGMGVAPEDCLVIEDGELGIEAARRAGMDWVRVEAVVPLVTDD